MTTKTSAQKQREIEEYWARRNRELEAAWHKKCKRTIEKELAAYYMQALRHIDDDISELYARFADQNGLDMTAAQRMLQGDEFRVWRMDIADYVQQIAKTGDKELLRELNVLAMRSRITRLDKLRGDTLVELAKLSAKVEKSIGKFLPSAYKDFYYHGLYEIGKKAGIAVPVAKVDAEKLENVTRIPWSGKNYSARIWHNSAELGKTIEQTMLTAMHRGSSLPDLSRYVAQRMNVGIHSAERLVQTELNFVQNKAALDSIKDAGMKYFRFIATLDRRTTPMCREHDGQTYEVESASVGTNMPPLHPRCRSTISGCLRALKDKPLGTRIARDPDTGKTTQYVPAGMKYEDWHKVFVTKEISLTDWKQAAGGSIIKVGGNYSCDLAKGIGKTHYDAAMNILDACPDDNAKAVWVKNEDKILIGDAHLTSNDAWAEKNKLFLNIGYESKGDRISKPYQTLFHESGHAIDSLHGKYFHFSAEFQNGAFAKAIHKDVDDRVKGVVKQLKPEFSKQLKQSGVQAACDWLLQNWLIESWQYNALRTLSAKDLKWSKEYAYKHIQNEIKKAGSMKAYGNVSDICEGATNGKISCGIGHKVADPRYWTRRTYKSPLTGVKMEDGLSTEAFAEFFDATVANADSLDLMKQYFPTAYSVFEDMLQELAQGVTP